MEIPDDILKQITCCLKTDNHIVNEPILVECGSNACKKCVSECCEMTLYCYSCNNRHDKKKLDNSTVNKIAESEICLYNDNLSVQLNKNLASIEENFQSKYEFQIEI